MRTAGMLEAKETSLMVKLSRKLFKAGYTKMYISLFVMYYCAFYD